MNGKSSCWRRVSKGVLVILMAQMSITMAKGEITDRSSIYIPGAGKAQDAVPVGDQTQLFIDDYLIESSTGVKRIVCQPQRDPAIPDPVVRGKEDRCFQPYFSVTRNPQTGRFRIWYGAWTDDQKTDRAHLAHMEGDDGINWKRPTQVLKDPAPIQFGSEVLDRGTAWKDPSTRYVLSYWYGGGLRLAVSGDGLDFRPLVDRVVWEHDHDINNVSWDDLRKKYVAVGSSIREMPKFSGGRRRTTLQTFSDDLIHWSEPWVALCADDRYDQGKTEFYAMAAFLNRGPLRIAMVKVLRDDVDSDTKEELAKRNGGYGTGYTTLAWTRDGQHWVRDRDVFFDRGPVGSWDRSHAWIDEQLPVGDEVYLYYAGYRSGHKANRFAERQIGFVKMPADRYVARQAEADGTLLTVPLKLDPAAGKLLLNVDSPQGSVRVRVKDAQTGQVLNGLDYGQCKLLKQDGLRTAVRWGSDADHARALAAAAAKPIRLEFELRNAKLFGFQWTAR